MQEYGPSLSGLFRLAIRVLMGTRMQTNPVESIPNVVSAHVEPTPPEGCADRKRGLSSAQVEEQRARFGRNIVDSTARRTWWRTLGEVLREPMFLLLLAASGIYFVLGDASEALTLLAFVMGIVFLTVFQSHRTAQVLDSLRELSAPRAQVLRDGQRRLVSAAELVPGDMVLVDEGARVPADGAVTEVHELSVDESLLTGESVSVNKSVVRPNAHSEEYPRPATPRRRSAWHGRWRQTGAGSPCKRLW